MPTFLTKSKFTHCLECPTKLYYKNHEEEYVTSQDDNDFLQALAEDGIQVGELAKLYYPDLDRREMTSKAIDEFAKNQQVLVITCHPMHQFISTKMRFIKCNHRSTKQL